MDIKVEFITARLNGKLLFVEPIQDCYSEVQVIVYKSDLDTVTLDALIGNMFVNEFDNSFNLGCYEAKDCTGTYGNLVVSIETRTFDFE